MHFDLYNTNPMFIFCRPDVENHDNPPPPPKKKKKKKKKMDYQSFQDLANGNRHWISILHIIKT